MRTLVLVALIIIGTSLKAQKFLPGSFLDYGYPGTFARSPHDSGYSSKWSLNRFSAVSSSYTFFRGGGAAMFSVPVGLQLNRRINNNLFAFANVSVAPTYINFNRSFSANDVKGNQNNTFFRQGNLNMYSRAALGLQYVNDERTFSISGSIGVQRSGNPFIPYNPVAQPRPSHFVPAN